MEQKEGKEVRGKHRWGLLLLAAAGLVLVLLTGFFCYRVELVTEAVTVELGSPVPEDPADYLEGLSFAVKRSQMDLSGVDVFTAGTYEALLVHGWQRFTVTVTVVDTTPPTLVLDRELKYLLRGQTYRAEEFVTSAKDLSGEVRVSIRLGNHKLEDSIAFNRRGEVEVVIVATDINANQTQKTLPLMVDTAPFFEQNMPDYYVALGSQVDYLEGIYAWDDMDGDLTDQIRYDASEVNLLAAGEYEVRYSVTDSCGFESNGKNRIRVYERMELQELINSHRITPGKQKIIGAYNLYDGGNWPEDDVESVLEKLAPAFVCLKRQLGNGSWTRGSGFIAEITEEEIILLTNDHVVHSYGEMEVYFYDGTRALGKVISTGAAACTEKDIAFVRVDRRTLPLGLREKLRTVHIEEDYWQRLPEQPELTVGLRCILDRGEVWHKDTGRLTVKKDIMSLPWKSYGLFSHVTTELIPGVSGSAILDGHGNLVGMAVGHGKVKGVEKYFAITLDNILSTYEEYLGHKPNYR